MRHVSALSVHRSPPLPECAVAVEAARQERRGVAQPTAWHRVTCTAYTFLGVQDDSSALTGTRGPISEAVCLLGQLTLG